MVQIIEVVRTEEKISNVKGRMKGVFLKGGSDYEYLAVNCKKMRFRKEQGEFKTYRDAYRWAITNISSLQVQSLTVQILERAYYKANSKGRRGLKKFPFP